MANTVRLTIDRLCFAWNGATDPAAYRTDAGHAAMRKAARKIMAMICRHADYGMVAEWTNGALYVRR